MIQIQKLLLVLLSSFAFLSYSMTPDQKLLEAATTGNRELAQNLIANYHINVNTQNGTGYTPLYLAAYQGDIEIAKLLVAAGANINAQHGQGETPLHIAAYWGRLEIVKFLLDSGAHVNTQTRSGHTPLHYAAHRGYTEITKLLINAGADITLKDCQGQTALDTAKQANNQEIIKILKEYQALQKEAQERPTKDTLRKAIQGNYPSIVKLLLKNSIVVDKDDLKFAKKLTHKEIGLMLIKYLGATTDAHTISKSGIIQLYTITPNIAQLIMGHTL